ncbi:MAG: TDP-N-acetylfucosamine:lipid II N-acetylfucosaminyltransferase [Bacteroidetes bacterium]|nr:TDP-N-acetylfucosamine:lipid II N-acetylfucosaminyltransferase [Bacteroidota bacterium]
MQTHIFTSESIYSKAFLQRLGDNLDLSDQIIVFRKQNVQFQFLPKRDSPKIIYATTFISFIFKVLPNLLQSKWIYIHYLPYGPSLLFWFLFRRLLKKTSWIVWGGDVFVYKEADKSLKNRFLEYLRKKIIPSFPEICSFIKDDALEAMKIYGSQAVYTPILYPIPLNITDLKTTQQVDEFPNHIKILVGNSADPSNFHLDTLEMISKFKHQPIKIYCPLSYYYDKVYIKTVIENGHLHFGENFIPILNMMSSQEYISLLKCVDVGIMNHNRQQALGNILPLLYLGKKVYLRKDVSTFNFLTSLGCIVYDISEIFPSKFEEFIEIKSEFQQSNFEKIKALTSDEYFINLWSNLIFSHKDDKCN